MGMEIRIHTRILVGNLKYDEISFRYKIKHTVVEKTHKSPKILKHPKIHFLKTKNKLRVIS